MTTFVALFVYWIIPIDSISGLRVAIRMATSFIVFGAVISYQVKAILKAKRPQIRAIEMLYTAVVLMIVCFSLVYLTVSKSITGSFSEALDRPSALYFTTTVLSTVGFGDIVAVSGGARMIVTVQMVIGVFFIGFFVKLLFGAAEEGISRQQSVGSPSDEATSE